MRYVSNMYMDSMIPLTPRIKEREVTLKEAQELAKEATSAIAGRSTAILFSHLLGTRFEENNVQVDMRSGDSLLLGIFTDRKRSKVAWLYFEIE